MNELSELVALHVAGLSTDEQFDRLSSLFEADEEARLYFVDHMAVHLQLCWSGIERRRAAAAHVGEPEDEDVSALFDVIHDDPNAADDIYEIACESSPPIMPLPPAPIWEADAGDDGLAANPPPAKFSWLPTFPAMAIVFLTGILVSLSVIGFYGPAQVAQETTVPVPQFVGEVTGVASCRWPDQSPRLALQDRVFLGQRFELEAGLLEITYDTGAKVTLQGPVTFEIDSVNSGFLRSGRLTGEVATSAAKGFSVRTPTVTIIDLGTEFGVVVDPNGRTASHVFRGEVKMVAATSGNRPAREVVLREKETCQAEKPAAGSSLVPVFSRIIDRLDQFVSRQHLSKQIQEYQRQMFQDWRKYCDELRKDPSLVAFYDFQRDANRPLVLPNVARQSDGSLDGVIEGAVWADGRMPGKQALRFAGPNSRVRINLPNKLEELTLAAWVYVKPTTVTWSEILGSEAASSDGQLHWMVNAIGGTGFDVSEAGRRKTFFSLAPRSSTPSDTANYLRWTHLAVVYSRGTDNALFFRNGKLEETVKSPGMAHEAVFVCPGSITLGGEASPVENRGTFSGQIDELAVFGRALTPEEIERIYRNYVTVTR